MTTCLEKFFIQFTARVFRELLSVYVCASFPFRSEGELWD